MLKRSTVAAKQKADAADANYIRVGEYACINPSVEFRLELADRILHMLDEPDNLIDDPLSRAKVLYLSIVKS